MTYIGKLFWNMCKPLTHIESTVDSTINLPVSFFSRRKTSFVHFRSWFSRTKIGCAQWPNKDPPDIHAHAKLPVPSSQARLLPKLCRWVCWNPSAISLAMPSALTKQKLNRDAWSMHWALRAILQTDFNKLNDKVSVKSELEKMAPAVWRVQGPQEDLCLAIEHNQA